MDKDFKQYLEMLRKTEDALSTTIKISHGQVLHIVVTDLIEKYKGNVGLNNRGDSAKWVKAFEDVLRFYLDDEEMERLVFGEPESDRGEGEENNGNE